MPMSRSQSATVEITSMVQAPITLHAGELRVSNGMTIENGSGAPFTIQQSTPNSRILHVLANPRTNLVTISGESDSTPLRLTGGLVVNANGGGILVDNPQNILTLKNVDVVGNSASQVTRPTLGTKGNGGGIYSRGSASLVKSSVSFNSAIGLNRASGHAGGVYTDRGLIMDSSHVDSNSARMPAVSLTYLARSKSRIRAPSITTHPTVTRSKRATWAAEASARWTAT